MSVESKDTTRKTEIVYGEKNIIIFIVNFIQNTTERMDLYGDKDGPSIIITHDIYKNNYVYARERAIKICYISEITYILKLILYSGLSLILHYSNYPLLHS